LRDYREKRGLSQERLAYFAGSTFTSISKYERGQTAPTFSVIIDIAFALGIDPGTLMRGLKPDRPPTER
jgi:transcriptional regulator with XRE-family HTH domain